MLPRARGQAIWGWSIWHSFHRWLPTDVELLAIGVDRNHGRPFLFFDLNLFQFVGFIMRHEVPIDLVDVGKVLDQPKRFHAVHEALENAE